MPERLKSMLDGLLYSASAEASPDAVVKRALSAVRTHLGMPIAYVSQFVGDQSVFREVDAPGLEHMIKPGDARSLDEVYCRHILRGDLPELMSDTSAEPLAAAMPITQAVPIGKHMSVPIRLESGEVYGMFCCLGTAPDPSLQERDLQIMRAFAELAAFEINREVSAQREGEEARARVRTAISQQQFAIMYQPICDTATLLPTGCECLARFSAQPSRTPDRWFAEASGAGLGVELELAAIRAALLAMDALPSEMYLAVNASPITVLSGQLRDAIAGLNHERIVLEITEHADVADYDELRQALTPLRARGVRLAIDDAGAGYSSLRHILQLQPDFIKLDMSLTRNICLDPARKALAAALVSFAREMDCRIIAEGVETAAELSTLKSIGVERVQGYFLGRPQSLDQIIELTALHRPATERDARLVHLRAGI